MGAGLVWEWGEFGIASWAGPSWAWRSSAPDWASVLRPSQRKRAGPAGGPSRRLCFLAGIGSEAKLTTGRGPPGTSARDSLAIYRVKYNRSIAVKWLATLFPSLLRPTDEAGAGSFAILEISF